MDALPRTTFMEVERDERYSLPVGFIKGGVFIIPFGDIEFNIAVREGTATGMIPIVHETALDVYLSLLHPS